MMMRHDPRVTCLLDGRDARDVRVVRVVRGEAAAFEGLTDSVVAFLRESGFRGRAGEIALLPGAEGVSGAVLVIDEAARRDPVRFGGLARRLPAGAWRVEAVGDHATEVLAGWDDDVVLGFCMGAYRYEMTETVPAVQTTPRLVKPEGARFGGILAAANWLGRDLINAPPNLLGPVELAEVARRRLSGLGAEVEIVADAALREEYPCLAHVAEGSDRPGRVVRARWGESGPHVVLVGKGVCFDTGGYDLKPASGMLRMKKDMGGAALMLALACAVMEAGLPLRLTVLLGCVENSVSGRAMRPSDVVMTRAGKTVEIGNTDAEGRLVLCDLLDEACGLQPDHVIDAATLTGAARVALGPDLPAVFSNDEIFMTELLNIGCAWSDDMWRLPLWHGYEAWLDSNVADFGNVASKPMAGAVTAALFLQKFVKPGVSWAHIDTYAWNDSSRTGRPEGGETLGLRALFGALLQRIKVSESLDT